MITACVHRWIMPCLLAGVTPACQTLQDPGAAYYQIRAGSALILNQELEIPANAARVRIQSGEVRPFGLVNQFYPYCEFEVRQVKQTTQSVQPDEFVIHRVGHQVYQIGASHPTVANFGLNISLTGGDGPRQIFYATLLHLRSQKQPDVLKLTCEKDQRGFPGVIYARHLTVAEIIETLGAILTLRIATSSSFPQPRTASLSFPQH